MRYSSDVMGTVFYVRGDKRTVIDPSLPLRMTPCRPLSFWTESRKPWGKGGKRNSNTEWRIYYADDTLPASLITKTDPSRSFRMTTDAFLTMTPCRPLSFWTESRKPWGKDGKRDSGTEWRIYCSEWHFTGFLTTATDLSRSLRMTLNVSLIMTSYCWCCFSFITYCHIFVYNLIWEVLLWVMFTFLPIITKPSFIQVSQIICNVVYMNIAWESMIVSPKDITFIILYIMKR